MPQYHYEPGDSWDEPMTRVESSNVWGIRQDGVDGIDLDVTFHDGPPPKGSYTPVSTYTYRGAGAEYYHMVQTHSKGQFVWYNLRPYYHADGPFSPIT
jgi:hypothetical protein